MAYKFDYSFGWYKISSGLAGLSRRFEVTYKTNSGLVFCENIRVNSYGEAVAYCHSRIKGASI